MPLSVDVAPGVPGWAHKRWNFQHVQIVGTVEHVQTLCEDAFRRVHHGLYAFFSKEHVEKFLNHAASWSVVQPTYENIMVASMKFDNPQDSSKYFAGSKASRILDILKDYYTPFWTTETVSWSEVFSDIDYDAASGLPFSLWGLQKKGDVLPFEKEFADFLVNSVLADVDVIFKASPKFEFLPNEHIFAHKIRLFITVGLVFVMWQKKLYLKQNLRTKNTRWVKLGTNMRQGGAHRLTRELEPQYPGDFVVELDLPRCDKNHKMMNWIYAQRNRCLLGLSPLEKMASEWILRNLTRLRVLLWDGVVIETRTSNPSGQANTGDDNCPWTLYVVLRVALEACPSATDADLSFLVLHVYSDDFRGLFPVKFSRMRDRDWFVKTAFECCGVQFKESDIKIYDHPNGSHFLGADCVLRNGVYYPLYSRERLYAAWQYTEGTLSPGHDLLRLRTLLILSYPHTELFEAFCEMYRHLLYVFRGATDHILKVVVALGMPSLSELEYAFTGREARIHGQGAFLALTTEEGGVKTKRMNVQRKGNQSAGVRPGNQKPSGPSSSEKGGEGSGGRGAESSATVLGKLEDVLAEIRRASPRQLYIGAGGGTKSEGSQPSAEGKTLGERVSRVASSVQRGHKSRVGLGGGQGAARKPVGRDVLAKGGASNNRGVGSPNFGRVGVSSVKKQDLTLTKDGEPVLVVPRTFGVKPKSMAGPPLAKSAHYRGSESQMHEYHDHRGRVVRVVGHQYLDSVFASGDAWHQGEHISTIAISPDALGGMLLLQAQQYEEHKCEKLRISYRPTCPATATGSIGMYFRNDVATPMLKTGIEEMTQAASHKNYVETQVWEPCGISIDPQEALKTYFDEDSGEMRMEVEGLFTVIAASSVPDLVDEDVFGNLYLEYDFEFFGAQLSYEIEDVITGLLEVTWKNNDEAQAGLPIELSFAPFDALVPGYYAHIQGDLPGPGYILYGSVIEVTGDPLNFASVGSEKIQQISRGTVIYVAVRDSIPGQFVLDNGTVFGTMYTNLADAASGYPHGILCKSGTNHHGDPVEPNLGQFKIRFRGLVVKDDGDD